MPIPLRNPWLPNPRHAMPVLTSHLLAFHWPKQVTWPSPASTGGEGEESEYSLNTNGLYDLGCKEG